MSHFGPHLGYQGVQAQSPTSELSYNLMRSTFGRRPIGLAAARPVAAAYAVYTANFLSSRNGELIAGLYHLNYCRERSTVPLPLSSH